MLCFRTSYWWTHVIRFYGAVVWDGRTQEREMRHRERFAAEKRLKDVQQLQVREQMPG